MERHGCKDCRHISAATGYSPRTMFDPACEVGDNVVTFDFYNGERIEYITRCSEKNRDGYCKDFKYHRSIS